MKKFTKVLLVILCAVLVAAGSVLGTLAYLTDRDAVVNTFTVGNVDIKLDETDVDENGVPIPEADRVKENLYHLIPGQNYVKDPTVTVAKGSDASYIRMKVTLTNHSQLLAAFGADFLPQNYVAGWDPAVWIYETQTSDADANTITYEFRYFETVDASDADSDIPLDALFDSFTLPGTVTREQLKELQGFEIRVVGHAIQAAGFASDDEAWAAFDRQNPEIPAATEPSVETTGA